MSSNRDECRKLFRFFDNCSTHDLNYLLDAVFDRLLKKDAPQYNYVINSMTRSATKVGERLREACAAQETTDGK